MGGMVTIFDPQGNRGEIPEANLAAAVRAGAMPGVAIKAPDGTIGHVPANRYREAASAGAQVLPFEQQDVKHPGFWSTLSDDVKGMASGAYHAVTDYDPMTDPNLSEDEKMKIADRQSTAAQAKNAQRTKEHGAAYSLGASANEMLGVNVAGEEKSAEEGDVGGVLGHAAAVPATMAATEGVARGVPAAARALRPAAAPILRAVSDVVSPDITGVISPRLAHMQRLAGRLADALTKPEKEFVNPGAPLPEKPPSNPGAPLPANPLPEQINPSLVSPARTLPGMHTPEVTRPPAPVAAPPAQPIPARPGLQLSGEVAAPAREARSIVVDPATGRPEFSDALAAKQAEVSTPTKATAVDLEKQLNDALGGKPLQRGVSLKNQIKAAVQSQAKLPEGFTPVDSSALKGYKYNPDAQEFESITTNGQRYIHGDVSPDQAAAFEAADSKGKAWNDLRSSSPLVAKVVDGRRIAAKPPVGMRSIVIDPQTGQPEFSDVVEAKKSAAKTVAKPKAPKPSASAAPPDDDLTGILQETLKQLQRKKAVQSR